MQYDTYEVVLHIDVDPFGHEVKLINDVDVIDLSDDWQVVKRDQGNARICGLVVKGEIGHVIGLIIVMLDVQVTNGHAGTLYHCSTDYGAALRIIEITTRRLSIPKRSIILHKFFLDLPVASHILQHRVLIKLIVEAIADQAFDEGGIGRTIAKLSIDGL